MEIYKERRGRKEKQINDFVREHDSAPKQRTNEWFLMRKEVIGASELAALVGMSPYDNFESIRRKKRSEGVSSYSNPACWWGTIFEDVAVKYAESEYSEKVSGTNICVKPKEGDALFGKHVVSPDGYGVVDFYKNENMWQLLRKRDKEKITTEKIMTLTALYEFKCPYRRHPKGYVPKHYLPQVWAGLEISPFANIGLFCEAVIRKCPKNKAAEWGEYDRNYHFNYDWGRELAWGASAVFQREPSEEIIDYGEAKKNDFDEMMGEAVEGQECKIVHSQLYETDYRRIEGGEGFYLKGFFYWKIFRFDVQIVKKNPGFMERCKPLIIDCLKVHE